MAWRSYEVVSGETRGFAFPHRYRTDATKPGVLVFHGRNGTGIASTDYATDIADHGFACCGADFNGPTNWGNPGCLTQATNANAALETRGAKTGPKLVWGASMGALGALAWARANPTLVKAVALCCPLLNLDDYHDLNTNGHAAEIDTAYGGLAAYNSVVANHDPAQFAAQISQIPVKVWYSPADELVSASYVAPFAAAHGKTTLQSVGQIPHDQVTVNTPIPHIVGFFRRYL